MLSTPCRSIFRINLTFQIGAKNDTKELRICWSGVWSPFLLIVLKNLNCLSHIGINYWRINIRFGSKANRHLLHKDLVMCDYAGIGKQSKQWREACDSATLDLGQGSRSYILVAHSHFLLFQVTVLSPRMKYSAINLSHLTQTRSRGRWIMASLQKQGVSSSSSRKRNRTFTVSTAFAAIQRQLCGWHSG